MTILRILLAVFFLSLFGSETLGQRTFEISPDGFMKDGEYFRYISGSVLYFRIHPNYWSDRLRKLRYAGFNAVQTYIEWASHEPEPGEYNFEGYNDVLSFLDTAAEEDLLVILRPGPFINSERDMGGLPYWLLRENPDMLLRSTDESYMYFVERWFRILFPMLEPYLYQNGGPVILVQIENEYSNWPACDMFYTAYLRDLSIELLGNETSLFTTNGGLPKDMTCGIVANVYSTVDFGEESHDVVQRFETQRVFEPEGPLVNSEFYSGWLDSWGYPHADRTAENVTVALDEILSLNASVNLYVFCGGTSFGMTAGAHLNPEYISSVTSYDFDGVLTETGDLTDKYWGIRNVTAKYTTLPDMEVPENTVKAAYGEAELSVQSGVFEMPEFLDTIESEFPLTFEALSVSNGIVVYSSIIPYTTADPEVLRVPEIHDRGYVFVDEQYVGLLSREGEFYQIPISIKKNQTLSIVAESLGRVCYGEGVTDFKGLLRNVTIGTQIVTEWSMTGLPLLNDTALHNTFYAVKQKEERKAKQSITPAGGMAFYEGVLTIDGDLEDTFLRLDGWGKGYAWINGFLLGRYWPLIGPQMTLYIPKYELLSGDNTILLLELEQAPCADQATCLVSFTDVHVLDGPIPESRRECFTIPYIHC